MRRLLPILTAVLLLAACGGDDKMTTAGTGAAGAVAGTAGVMPAGTGVTGGTAGMAGTGGTGGVAGTAGTGGTAGMAGAGGMAAPAIKTCADYAASGAPRGTKDAVATILRGTVDPTDGMVGSCAFSSCHDDTSKATLNLDMSAENPTGDIGTVLVNVPACQVEGYSRVTPGNPAMSWLWIKLTGPFNADGVPQSTATPKACRDTTSPLGGAMPWTGGASIPLLDEQLYQICTWIEDGAL